MKGMPILVTVHPVYGIQTQLMGRTLLVASPRIRATWRNRTVQAAIRRLQKERGDGHLRSHGRTPLTAAKATLANGTALWFYLEEVAGRGRESRLRPELGLVEWTGPVVVDTAEPAEVA
jgi:hypothetical protein